jgi:hypothetical protein
LKGIYCLLRGYANYGSPELVLSEWFSRTCPFNMIHQNLTIQHGLTKLVLAEWFSRTCLFNMVYDNLSLHNGSPQNVYSLWFTRTRPFTTIYALSATKYIRRILILFKRIFIKRNVMPPSFPQYTVAVYSIIQYLVFLNKYYLCKKSPLEIQWQIIPFVS